jgi:hypothetical protein
MARLVVDAKDNDVVSGLIGGEQIGVGRIDRDVFWGFLSRRCRLDLLQAAAVDL